MPDGIGNMRNSMNNTGPRTRPVDDLVIFLNVLFYLNQDFTYITVSVNTHIFGNGVAFYLYNVEDTEPYLFLHITLSVLSHIREWIP
jgi:hypothetical protein